MGDNQCWITIYIMSHVQQLGVGMFGCEVISNAFLPSKFALVDTANASLANFNPFTEQYWTFMIRFFVISYKNYPFFTLDMASFPSDSTVCCS